MALHDLITVWKYLDPRAKIFFFTNIRIDSINNQSYSITTISK